MEEKIISAKTLDEAITKACVDLGVPSDELEYTVKQTGSNGFFGLGAKPFVISARIKSAVPEVEPVKIEKEEPVQKQDAPAKNEKAAAEVKKEAAKPERKPEKNENRTEKKERQEKKPKADRQPRPEKKEVSEPKPEKKPERRSEKPAEDPTPKAEEFLTSLFKSMDMQINCKAQFDPENNELAVDLSGDDMGVLIGKRGQTLDALQYLTSQVINKHQNTYVRVKLDTENYRERRKETLETLAQNISHKVRRTHRPVALEPMNPYERRIIHSVLQNEKDVFTRSEGEEPYRHVIVCPTRRKRQGGKPAGGQSPKAVQTAPSAQQMPAEAPAEATAVNENNITE